MKLSMLVFLVNIIKDTQTRFRTEELLKGLTFVYELSAEEFSEIQQEFYKLSHPAMENYEEKDSFEAELLGVNFLFTKKA